jgi:purine-binding chemotaxis protein CheW
MPDKHTTTGEVQKRVAGWEQANITQLIVFQIGKEAFGIPIDDVREIIRTGTITPIPDSPPFVKGLINVRGDIIPTIDLRICFTLPDDNEDGLRDQHVVVTRNQPSVYGLLVDEVTEVLRIPKDNIKPPPKLLTTIHEDYVAGVVTVEEKLTIILDLKEILSDEEVLRLNESTRRHLIEEDGAQKTKGGKKKKIKNKVEEEKL